MVYRKKLLLSLLKEFDGKLDKLSLQKLLFLYCNDIKNELYEFIPYKFGAYSFTVNTDLVSLKKAGFVKETDTTWEMVDFEEDLTLSVSDTIAISKLKKGFADYSSDDLLSYTYTKYPYYAVNSVVAHRILSKDQFAFVQDIKNTPVKTGLFTIGYEGRSTEKFFNTLLQNGIKLLCDVRKNAYSMKPGFSKAQLKLVCENIGIMYKHYPELGISSELRKDLKDDSDYDSLFGIYEEKILPDVTGHQKKLLEDQTKIGNAVLVCFEADKNHCHRSRLAKSLVKLSPQKLSLYHL